MTTLVRILRSLGWLCAAIGILPVIVVFLVAVLRGPAQSALNSSAVMLTSSDVLAIPEWMWRSLARTMLIAGMAVTFAFLIALPAAFALSQSTRRATRAGLAALIAWPLLAPPCVIAYAWTLLASQKTWLARFLVDGIGWNTPGMGPVVAAWIQATWLWPIPALAMAVAYRLHGRAAFRLALLDAAPGRAFRSAALPAMRGTIIIAAVIVALLSLADATISPLMLVRVWPMEMLDEATRAHRYLDPTRYVIWRSWPMLVVVGVMAVLTFAFARPALRSAGSAPTDELGLASPRLSRRTVIAIAATAAISLLPLLVLIDELRHAATPLKSLADGLQLYHAEWSASLMVAGLAAVFGVAMGILAMSQPGDSRRGRRLFMLTLATLLLTSLLPPVVIGRSLITAFDRPLGIPSAWNWHPYDDSPLAWLAGVVARFGFLPMLLVWIANRAAGDEAVQAARAEGATRTQITAYIQLPTLVRPLAAAGILLGCLALSELPVAGMVAPVRFGGSLSVTVDQQVHFGRQTEVIATSLLLALPAMLSAAAIALLLTRRPRTSHKPHSHP